MRVVGLLSWYDESPTWLSTAVAGFAQVCDAIVAVDGAYGLYPRARPKSHPQQVEAILHTAESLALGCLVYQPEETWTENELGKRNKALELAGTLDPDWVLIFDADFHVARCNAESVRWELEHTELHVATYTLLDLLDYQSNGATTTATEHEWRTPTRDIYRWNPTLKVGPAHWCYSAVIDEERKWLRGPYADLEDALDLRSNLMVYHRTQDRTKRRQEAQESYYKLRDIHQIETTDLEPEEVMNFG